MWTGCDYAGIGRVGAGVIVRTAATAPTVATGLYLERLFEKLGVMEAIKPKTIRYADGAAVLEHVIKGTGNEIGFGAITEIRMYESKGLRWVGPLPAEVQNYASYDAALMTGAKQAEAVRVVLQMLASPAGKVAFVSGRVESRAAVRLTAVLKWISTARPRFRSPISGNRAVFMNLQRPPLSVR